MPFSGLFEGSMVAGLRFNPLRQRTREITGTRIYQFRAPAIAASAQWDVWLENTAPQNGAAGDTAPYLPFDELVIKNNSGQPFYFYINQKLDNAISVFNGQVVTVENQPIWGWKAENFGSAFTPSGATQLIVEVQRKGATGDTVARKVYDFLNPLAY